MGMKNIAMHIFNSYMAVRNDAVDQTYAKNYENFQLLERPWGVIWECEQSGRC